jgi:hypothetical protein
MGIGAVIGEMKGYSAERALGKIPKRRDARFPERTDPGKPNRLRPAVHGRHLRILEPWRKL